MEIRPSGSAASRRAPVDYFTGAVWQDPIVEAPAPGNVRASVVRFEPGMNSDHTLEEVGQQFSVTRERIRQIEAKALRKLRHPGRSRALWSFLDN